MDAAVLGDRLLEGTQKPLLGPGSPSLQSQHWESSKVLGRLAFCEMLSQYPRSAFQGLCGGHQRGSAAVCDPDPPRPFARSRYYGECIRYGDSKTLRRTLWYHYFKGKASTKSPQIVKTTTVVKHYGIECRSGFCTEGSYYDF